MADSGHKSLISNTNGTRFNLDKTYAVIPTNNGGEVTKITSYFPFVLNKPA